MASLTDQSFDFNSDPSTVTVEARYSKRRRRDTLPLHPDLEFRLREWMHRTITFEKQAVILIDDSQMQSDRQLWPGRWAENRHAAKMLRADLEKTGISYFDDEGEVFDFHALRHQFISMLALNGIHPKTAQELARHSKITLTMDHYTHLRMNDTGAALASLPGLLESQPAVHQATGTDDADTLDQQSIACFACASDDQIAIL